VTDITKKWLDVTQPYYNAYMPYSDVDQAKVTSGLRKTPRACQYFVNNLPSRCKNWSDSSKTCTVSLSSKKSPPTHYNKKKCDSLGRASRCDYYEEGSDSVDQWVCIAPCVKRSGLMKRLDNSTEDYIAGSVPIDDIAGYNETDGVGVCDGEGYGKGKNPGEYSLTKLEAFPTVCKYYRSWSMGFGAVTPKPGVSEFVGGSGPTGPKHQRVAYAEALKDLENFEKRLPFNFEIYNYRAKYQKCGYWKSNLGGVFHIDPNYDNLFITCYDGATGIEATFNDFGYCENSDALSRPYRYSDFDIRGTPPDFDGLLTTFIWSTEAGGYVCNGAKPECPCYTGHWNYCVDAHMKTGMRITANQILELRFWSSYWENKEEYDDFFQQRPSTNPNDPSSSKIYTFSSWKKGQNINDAVMVGYEYDICLPSTIWNREFEVETYVTKTALEYPKMNVEMGTRSPGAPSYPTLIRNLNLEIGFKQLDIFYPYTYADQSISNEVACEQRPAWKMYTKRSHSLDGDSIIIVGATEPGTTVYVFNLVDTELMSNLHPYIKNNRNARKIAPNERDDIFGDISSNLLDLMRLGSEYYVKATAEDDGVFITDPLKLEYNRVNSWIVLAKFNDGTFEWRKRSVFSSWTGGIIVQTSFSCFEGGGNSLPQAFLPGADIAGKAVLLGDTARVDTIMNVSSVMKPSLFLGDTSYYSYCLREKTVTTTVTNWAKIGNSNRIWMEIDDINLNYIFEWSVESATMTVAGDGGFCGEVGSVSMDVKYPTSFNNQINFLPNGCILEPEGEKLYKFSKSNCVLEVTYKYTFLSNDLEQPPDGSDEAIIFPSNFNISSGYGRPGSVPYILSHTLNVSGENFTVNGVISNTVSLMALFTDVDGRICSSFATNMLLTALLNNCRSVEIEYKYEADAAIYRMDPSSGFRTRPFTPVATGESRIHYERNPCGDHSCNPYDCRGPMWYPFGNCSHVNLFIIYDNAASCVSLYPGCEEGGRPDMRFCHVHESQAWTEDGPNVLSTCGLQWVYFYSKVGSPDDVRFAGHAAAVSKVSSSVYSFWDWDFPPFGNEGRDIIERFITQDHMCHFIATGLTSICEWMPYAIDNKSFYMSCNSMESYSDTVGSQNCYTPIHQLNMLICDSIGEYIFDENVRWEDAVGVDGVGNCSYPYPSRELPGFTVGVNFYHFQEEDYAWLWENFWRPIERAVNNEKLRFVKFDQPDYDYDIYKEQFRYICDEGFWDVTFTPPLLKDGIYKKYPSIQLGNGEPRFFEIKYDLSEDGDYSSQVEWRDESTSGNVDGSGGDDSESNATIYEKTSDDDWEHSENILFDAYAVETTEEAKSADRERLASSGQEGNVYKYFNRGLIANITKESLKYMPYEESWTTGLFSTDIQSKYTGSYLYGPGERPTITFTPTEDGGFCPSKIIISGKWGQTYNLAGSKDVLISKPGITVTGTYRDISWGLTRNVFSSSSIASERKQQYSDFEITINLEIEPLHMVDQRLLELKILLSGATDQWIYVDSIQIFEAEYIQKTERINVFEKRYTVSKYNPGTGENLDGPGKHLYFRPEDGSLLSGLYFPIASTEFSGETVTRNKMRSVAAGILYPSLDPAGGYEVKEYIDVDVGSLIYIEENEQKNIYNEMLDREGNWDTINFYIQLPPQLKGFLEHNNIPHKVNLGTCVFRYKPSKWETLPYNYDGGYASWMPLGHYWRNSESIQKEVCWFVGGVAETLYNAEFVHADTGEGDSPVSATTALYWKSLTAYDIAMIVNDYSKGGKGFGVTGIEVQG
jgi:hypothetical protein